MPEEEYLSSSMEDYLEAIVVLKKRNGIARVRDLGQWMEVKNPSVTNALNILANKGLVLHEKYGYVELTEQGEKIARSVLNRHEMLTDFLANVVGVDAKTAEEDACKMEHLISTKTADKLLKFIKQYRKDTK